MTAYKTASNSFGVWSIFEGKYDSPIPTRLVAVGVASTNISQLL